MKILIMKNYIRDFRSFMFVIVFLLAICLPNTLKCQPNTPWPEWVFHHWVWEDESTQESAIALVDDYLAHGIPVGAIIIDSPWETGYNTFDWDTTLYPDPQAMIDYFHSIDVKVLMWITTAINTDMHSLYHYADSMGYFMQETSTGGAKVINWWKGDGSMIDFFNPDAVAWWKSLMDKTLDMGIDGWKCDGTDYLISPLIGNATYSPGAGRVIDRLEYSHAYYRLFHDYTRQKLGNDRVNMSRPVDNYGVTFLSGDLVAFTPKDIGWACWVGDQDATFNGMKNALNNMYHSDAYGYLIFGSDIGGYRENGAFPPNMRSKELFIRWAQLGAFSPLMENGGGGEHRPWMFDEQTTDIYRMFTKLHYALIPYFMEQSDSLFDVGKSMMQFFNDSSYSYMLGSDIFVTPVLSESNIISIDLPQSTENWVYLFNKNQVYPGNSNVTLNIPPDEYPVFLKASSILISVLDSIINLSTEVEISGNTQPAIKIYPNPAGDKFQVHGLSFESGVQHELKLYDLPGRQVLTSSINNDKIIQVTGLEPGIYLYTIAPANGQPGIFNSGKIVIQ